MVKYPITAHEVKAIAESHLGYRPNPTLDTLDVLKRTRAAQKVSTMPLSVIASVIPEVNESLLVHQKLTLTCNDLWVLEAVLYFRDPVKG